LQITLYVQDRPTAVAIASVWKQQMARIGVEVTLEVIAPDVYFGEGKHSWLAVDFGITEWEARSTPATYFKLAYTGESRWNESHWSDPELDSLIRRIDGEPDRAKRVALYHRAQKIFIERGPIIVAFFEKTAVGINEKLKGVVLPAAWAGVRFREVYFDN
jgi:peptide/nickel transport system substrate-binding protein